MGVGSFVLDFMDLDSDVCTGPFGFGTLDGDACDSSFPLDDVPVPHDHDHADPSQYVDGPGCEHVPVSPQNTSCLPGDLDVLRDGPGSWLGPNSSGVDPSGTARSVSGAVAAQPTVSETVHHAIFSRALLTNCDVTNIVLPWETGFYKEFFSDEPFLRILRCLQFRLMSSAILGANRNLRKLLKRLLGSLHAQPLDRFLPVALLVSMMDSFRPNVNSCMMLH